MMGSMLKASRRAFLLTAGVASVPLLVSTVMAEGKSRHESSKMVKISDMSLYDDPKDLYYIEYHVSEKGKLEEGVSTVRKELTETIAATKELQDQVQHVYQTGKAHTAGQISYLLDKDNVGARAGAIAVGGVLGLLMGVRRKEKLFKKLVYTSAGAGVTTAVLHPKQTRDLSEGLVTDANTYANVAYNFVIGVKPQQLQKSEKSSPDVPLMSTPVKKVPAVLDSIRRETNAKSVKSSDAAAADQSNPADTDMYTTRN